MLQKTLLYSSSVDEAIKEVREAGGFVPLQLTNKIFVAIFPEEFSVSKLKLSSNDIPEKNAGEAKLLIEAWKKAYERIKEKQTLVEQKETINWDTAGLSIEEARAPDEQFTPKTMNGKIAAGVLIVSGPYASDPLKNLEFTPEEYIDVVSEALEAFFFLSSSCQQANINFFITTFIIPISTPQENIDCQKNPDKCRDLFRNPALEYLGYAPSDKGVLDLLENLKTTGQAQCSYLSYFVKYNVKQVGGAKPEKSSLFIQYNVFRYSDQWREIPLSQGIAHETCHIFGAKDEYKGCNCMPSGLFSVPNKNCGGCSPTQTVCLMQAANPNVNGFTLCNWTRGQIGWGYWKIPFDSRKISISNAPSIAFFKNKYYLALRALDGKLCTSTSTDGKSWTTPEQINGSLTSDSPSLCVFNDKLWIAIKGNDNRVYTGFSSDGKNWNQLSSLGDSKTSAAPCICVFKNKLFIALKAYDKKNQIYMGSYDGLNWTKLVPINNGNTATSAAPTLAVLNELIYIAFKPTSGNSIYIGASSDGTRWPSEYSIIPTNKGTTSPVLTTVKDYLYIAFTSIDSSKTVCFGALGNGEVWTVNAITTLGGLTSNFPPAIIFGANNNMLMAINNYDSKNLESNVLFTGFFENGIFNIG